MRYLLSYWMLFLALAGAGCSAPVVAPAPDAPDARGTLYGDVIYTGPGRGDVVVLLFSANDPPPPEGTGRPRNFTVIPAARLFGSDLAPAKSGPFSAPFSLGLIVPGRYTVRAFLDVCPEVLIGCHGDFVPFYSVTAQPSLLDAGGGHAHKEGAKVVFDEVVVGPTQPTTGVGVALLDEQRFPGRPVFRIEADPPPRSPFGSVPGVFRISAAAVNAGAISETDGAEKGFLVRHVDLNGDGVADDRNGDSLPDVFPMVFLRKLSAEHPLRDENDLDGDGRVDALPELNTDYPFLLAADVSRPRAAVIPAMVDPVSILPMLADSNGRPDLTKSVFLKTLDIVVGTNAVDAADPKDLKLLKEIPVGRYAVVLVSPTGQTWRLPNELGPGVIDVVAPGASAIPEQGAAFIVKR